MDEVRTYEGADLPEHRKVALRFADAFLRDPAGFDRSDLEHHFSQEQIVELLFKLMYWSCNKPLIALGIDGPANPDALTEFHYSEQGAFVLHT